MSVTIRLERARRAFAAPLGLPGRLALLLGFALLVAARIPAILEKGRFWAEEGNKFFVFGWSLPWWRALFSPWGGYLNITANLGGILAWHAVPLVWAPYATTGLAFLVQLFPAILLLTSRVAWLKPPLVLAAALLMVLAVPASEEIWLSSIGSQVFLSLCAAIILAIETGGGAVGAFRLGVLALAALSGPGSWLLVPLFAGRAVLERSGARAVQAAVLAAAVLVQVVFFYTHISGRAYVIRPLLFLDLAFDKHILLAFLGPERTTPIANLMQSLTAGGRPPHRYAVAMLVIVCGALLAVWRRWRSEAFWLLLAAATMIFVSYAGALGDVGRMFPVGPGSRYIYAPQVLIGLAMLGISASRRDVAGWICTALAAWVLATGAVYYFIPSWTIFADGPAFRLELLHHQKDHRYRIHSWPPEWIVRMPDDEPPVAS